MERPPPSPARVVMLGSKEGRASAADLEDLASTDRTGALEGGLAVLHGDALGIQDFDFLLVLDAIGLGHSVCLLGCDASVTGTFVPYPPSGSRGFGGPQRRAPAVRR